MVITLPVGRRCGRGVSVSSVAIIASVVAVFVAGVVRNNLKPKPRLVLCSLLMGKLMSIPEPHLTN